MKRLTKVLRLSKLFPISVIEDKATRMISKCDHHFSLKTFKEVLFQVVERVEKEIGREMPKAEV